MVTKAGKSLAIEVAGTKVAKSSVTSEVASGCLTRSGRNPGTFMSAEASITKNASGRNAGAFAHGKSAVEKTASLHAWHMEEDMSAKATNSPGELVVPGSKSLGELVVPGKSPPDCTAKDKAIAAVTTDLNATALAKESSSNTKVLLQGLEKLQSRRRCAQRSVILFVMNSYIVDMNSYNSMMF
jgi:hypothetical protein